MNTKKGTMKLKLKKLLELRDVLVEMGEGMEVLGINEEIARMARKLKLDYYSL